MGLDFGWKNGLVMWASHEVDGIASSPVLVQQQVNRTTPNYTLKTVEICGKTCSG